MNRIGPYVVEAELGRGGMGVVYRGYDEALDRTVAIKLLSAAVAHEPSAAERFVREARAMAKLTNANVVQVHFVGTHEGRPFLAMEFVSGCNLAELLQQRGPLPPAVALGYIEQAARGLKAAHAVGLVHRDIKPANLILSDDGVIKVTDFGIALVANETTKLTGTGMIVGTPGYLSPELCMGETIDARSDLFSLGVVLYELLAGKLPYRNTSPVALMMEIVQADVPDVRAVAVGIDAATAAIQSKLLNKDPNARFQNCEALLQAIQAPSQTRQTPPIVPFPPPPPMDPAPLPRPNSAPVLTPMPRAQPAVVPLTPSPRAVVIAQSPRVPGDAVYGKRRGLIGLLLVLLVLLMVAGSTTVNVLINSAELVSAAQDWAMDAAPDGLSDHYLALQKAIGLNILVHLPLIVVFLIWQFRALGNAGQHTVATLSPGLAVGGWFIPVAQLYFSLRGMLDLVRGATADTVLVWCWWALFWIAICASLVSLSMSIQTNASTVQQVVGHGSFRFLAELAWLTGILLLVVVVCRVSWRQRR